MPHQARVLTHFGLVVPDIHPAAAWYSSARAVQPGVSLPTLESDLELGTPQSAGGMSNEFGPPRRLREALQTSTSAHRHHARNPPVRARIGCELDACAPFVGQTAAHRPRTAHRKGARLQALLPWRDPDSNWGHHDFQSCALPTELSRRTGPMLPAHASGSSAGQPARGSGSGVRIDSSADRCGSSHGGSATRRPSSASGAMTVKPGSSSAIS